MSDYHADAIGLLVTRGKDLGFIRPSSRLCIQTPDLSGVLIVPIPEGLLLEQVPNFPPDRGLDRNRSPKKRKKKQASGHQSPRGAQRES